MAVPLANALELSMIGLIVTLLLIGLLFWAAQRILAVIPVAEPFKTIVYVLIVVLAVLICLDAFGLISSSFPLHLSAFRC